MADGKYWIACECLFSYFRPFLPTVKLVWPSRRAVLVVLLFFVFLLYLCFDLVSRERLLDVIAVVWRSTVGRAYRGRCGDTFPAWSHHKQKGCFILFYYFPFSCGLNRVAIRPALCRTVRFFKALSGVRRSIKPDAYLSSFWDTPAGHRSVVCYDGTPPPRRS